MQQKRPEMGISAENFYIYRFGKQLRPIWAKSAYWAIYACKTPAF